VIPTSSPSGGEREGQRPRINGARANREESSRTEFYEVAFIYFPFFFFFFPHDSCRRYRRFSQRILAIPSQVSLLKRHRVTRSRFSDID